MLSHPFGWISTKNFVADERQEKQAARRYRAGPYPGTWRGAVTGQVMFAIPVAGVIGGAISGWIMSHMGGIAGHAGWQWMFLIEGIPTALLGKLSCPEKPAV